MSLTHGTTSNEGCTLHFTTILPSAEESIQKPLLILVPGGSGHSTQFLPMLPYFTPKFQPATYSRRQHGLSTPEPGKSEVYLNIARQARDLLAVASALGFGSEKLYLFCSSGGGIIAFQLAVSYPNRIAHMIAHEAGTVGLLTDSEKYVDLFHQVYSIYLSEGKEAAYKIFRRFMSTGYEDAETPLPRLGGAAEGDDERFLKYELLQFLYFPDLRLIRENGTSAAVAWGKGSGEEIFYVRATVLQAQILGCERYMLPGNHTGFRYEPEAFADGVLKIFGDLEEKNNNKR